MDFTKDQKREAYKSLDERQKEFVSSEDYTKSLQAIGSKYDLLLDKTGILGDIVFEAILGLIKLSDIDLLIARNLEVTGQKHDDLINDINKSIFIPFRQLVMSEKSETDIKNTNITPGALTESPTRDSILAEIENPTPTIHPISAADQTVAGPSRSLEIIPETVNTVARDFIGSKLTETVSLPSQKAAVTLKAPEVKPKSYAADPYRESIN